MTGAMTGAMIGGLGSLVVLLVAIGLRQHVITPSRRFTAEGIERRRGRGRSRVATAGMAALTSAVVGLVVTIGGPIAGATLGATLLLHRQLRPTRAARIRRATIERRLPAAIDQLVLGVRAGLTPQQAVRDLAASVEGPVGRALAEVVHRTERGHTFADALAALPEQLGTSASGLADVIATSDRHGLPLGPVLDQLVAEARAARRRLAQADARRLPVRLSFPLVICTLPSFVLLAIVPAVIAAMSSLGGSAR